MNKFLPVLLVTMMSIVGCSSDNDDPKQTGTPTVLEGSWSEPCWVEADGTSHLETITFSGNSATNFDKVFLFSASCDGDHQMEISANLNLSIGSETTSTPDGDASQIDLTVQNVYLKVVDATVIPNINTLMVCDFSDWVVDTAKIVNGLNCDPDDPTDVIPDYGDVLYDIFLLSNNGNSLNFGDTDTDPAYDGSTALKRPIFLETVTSIKL